MNPKRATPGHVIIAMTNVNDKKRILKVAKERQLPTKDHLLDYKMISQQKTKTKTHQARREWNEVYKVLQSKGLNSKILYLERLSIKIEGSIQSFIDKKKC